MPKFLVSIRESSDREFVVEAESADAVEEMDLEKIMAADNEYADYGGDIEITGVQEFEE